MAMRSGPGYHRTAAAGRYACGPAMAQTDVLPGPEPAALDDEAGAPDLSVVVTVLNEAGTIEELYRRTVAALESLERPFEVIVVDDGSTDGTFAALGVTTPGAARCRAS